MRLASDAPWSDLPEIDALGIAPVPLEQVTEILPIGGADVSLALEAAAGVGMPVAGQSARHGDVLVIWSGRDAALLLGKSVEIQGAVCVDQSDGWAGLELCGEVREVLARLCPADLREGSFPVGAVARTLLGHVAVCLVRTSSEKWLLLVPRSMARTVMGALVSAAEGVAARRRD